MENKNQDPSVRLTRRGKIALAAGALVTAGAALLTFQGHGSEADKPQPVDTYTVQPGDTLSNVAEEVAQNTPEHETMQQAAENIRDINGLPATPQLVNGEELKVPASADVDKIEPGVQFADDSAPAAPESGQLPTNPPVEEAHTGIAPQ